MVLNWGGGWWCSLPGGDLAMSADVAGCHNRAVQWVETRNAAESLTRQRTARPPPHPWQPLSCQKVNSADVEKLRSLLIMYDLTVEGTCDKMSLLSYHFLIHYMLVGGTEVNTLEKHLLPPPPHPSPHQPLRFPFNPADLTAPLCTKSQVCNQG